MVLLDTCTFIWLCARPDRLSPLARQTIDEAHTIYLSDVSVFELTLKHAKLGLGEPPRRFVESQSVTWNLTALPITREVMYRTTELPNHHRDPFDRLLVAQAIVEDLTLLTPDEEIHKYPVAFRWH